MNTKRQSQVGRDRAAHHLWYVIGRQFAKSAFAKGFDRLEVLAWRANTGADNQSRARMSDFWLTEPGIVDGLAHGMVCIDGGICHKTAQLAVDRWFTSKVRKTGELAVEAQVGIFFDMPDSATIFA
mgnify:CR=1 FL=1